MTWPTSAEAVLAAELSLQVCSLCHYCCDPSRSPAMIRRGIGYPVKTQYSILWSSIMTSSSTTATDNSFHMGAIHLSVPANMAACQVFTCVSMVKTQPAVMMDRQQLQFKLTDPPLTRKQFICNSFHFFFVFFVFISSVFWKMDLLFV